MGATCSKGCSHCCHLLTVVTLPEAVAIAERLLTDPTWQQQLPALVRVLYSQIVPLADPNLTRASYFSARVPCVFLHSTDNTCRIYDIRPTACRYHLVVSDPKNCAFEAEDTRTAIIDLRALESKVWEDSVHASKQLGLPLIAAPFQVVLLWALKLIGQGKEAFLADLKRTDLGVMSLGYWMRHMVGETPLSQETVENAKKALTEELPPLPPPTT